MADLKRANRTNGLLVVGAAIVFMVIVVVTRSRSHEAAARRASEVQFFDGGYAVGPKREIDKVIRASTEGTRTACEQPPPTTEERARWKRGTGALGSLSMTDLLARPDPEMTVEIASRLLDKTYGTGYAAMSREEQNVHLVSTLEAEVINGGLDQFFTNSSGNCALRTSAALDEIGLAEQDALFRRALADFPDASPSEDRRTRFDQIDALGRRRDDWSKFDDFEGIGSSPKVASYIRSHASAFVFPP